MQPQPRAQPTIATTASVLFPRKRQPVSVWHLFTCRALICSVVRLPVTAGTRWRPHLLSGDCPLAVSVGAAARPSCTAVRALVWSCLARRQSTSKTLKQSGVVREDQATELSLQSNRPAVCTSAGLHACPGCAALGGRPCAKEYAGG